MRDEIHPPGKEREEPPFVQGLLMTATARVADGLPPLPRVDRFRIRLFLWGTCSLVIFLVIVSLSVIRSPDPRGYRRGHRRRIHVCAGLRRRLRLDSLMV